MLRWLWRFAPPVAAVAFLFGVSATSRADSIHYTSNSLATSGPLGNMTWTYHFNVSSDATVQADDFFVIVDFGGYVAGSIFAPATGWSVSTEPTTAAVVANNTSLTGITPAVDNAGIPNLRFTYTGSSPLGPSADLGAFGARTSVGGRRDDGITIALDHDLNTGLTEANTGFAPVPVPMPATANMGLMLFAGIGGVGAWRRMKSRQGTLA